MKKYLALLLAGILVLGSVNMAFADDPEPEAPATTESEAEAPTGSITIKPSDTVSLTGKTLNAYKILNATYGSTGTLGGDPAQAVSYTIPASMSAFYDAYFGQEADSTATPPVAAKTATELAAAEGKTVDLFVAEKIAALGAAELKDFEYAALAYATDAAKGNLTAVTGSLNDSTKYYEFKELEAGYYIIEDKGTATPISALMLDTVTNADVQIVLKAEDKSEKEIMTAEDLVNSKANELGLGKAVNYKITQELPDVTGYDYFYYMVNDTLSTGLTFNPDSLKVYITKPAVEAQEAVGNPEDDDYQPAVAAQEAVTSELQKGTDYWLYYDNGAAAGEEGYDDQIASILNGKTFIVAFDDIVSNDKLVPGYKVEVVYTATVNSEAVVGVDPNNNKANVVFSNNPDKDQQGDWDEDHPGIPKNDGNHPTGEGPNKWTDTYTEKITILKVDGSNNDEPLPGVEFTLVGTAKDAVFDAEEVFKIDPAGTYWLLKDGTYTTKAPETVATLQETTGGAGWVEIVSGDTYNKADIRVIGDKKYRPYVEATDSALTRYVIIEPNDEDYDSITTKYSKETKTADDAEEYAVFRTGVTAASTGELSFSQLGAGTYKLSETGVLAGYNGLPDITFTLECTLPDAEDVIAGTEKASWEIKDVTPSNVSFVAQTDGTFKITLQNNTGTELPSTGGIGTTLFYAGGAILVLLAGILLVSKRRMA